MGGSDRGARVALADPGLDRADGSLVSDPGREDLPLEALDRVRYSLRGSDSECP
jgi:hypothetical protein